MYFHRRPLSSDPFQKLGIKRSVYHSFFKKGTGLGFDMYVANGKENYEPPLTFKDAYLYTGNFFELQKGIIEADAVFDRSGGISFPPVEIGQKTLNSSEFKHLCHDKNLMGIRLGRFMPRSFVIKNQEELLSQLKSLEGAPLAVLKPAKGMQGKGILIDKPENLAHVVLEEKSEYVLQEFVDTSQGIPGITEGYHDLRIVVVNGKITLAHVRTPKEGSLLANVALGGSIEEVPLEKIPSFILSCVQEIQAVIDEEFDFPLYSIDFGIQAGSQPFVFELNDQIGFPSEKMNSSELFIENTLEALAKRASR
ncbi:MAG: hypothetical protein A2808_03650 [Candidatus Moranbacteria bacterium RIFCSPHIGHO2_01_FULL_55_24]|nr:MAG: hypothetical protein A2808_03650 [Candidatus Moranbacteria bacterium RIFCSPHIGHO2_01_FULL_55_24]